MSILLYTNSVIYQIPTFNVTYVYNNLSRNKRIMNSSEAIHLSMELLHINKESIYIDYNRQTI